MRQNQLVPVAIILAAGRGGRLGPLTADRPKCLLEVGGRSLLDHQLDALRSQGVELVVVVAGYRADAVEADLAGRATVLLNPRHAETNSLYSLWLARQYAEDGFVLLNADVLFDPEILQRVLASPHSEALAVERRERFDAEEMKVELEGERIRALSKSLPPERAQAENVGVLKFSAAGARALFDKMEELLAAGAEKQFAPYGFNALAAERPLYATPIDGLPWIEIDFVEDLLRAREEIWPAILARRTARRDPETAAVISAANPAAAIGN
ncbi:MAG TPA: phosphocholine cytidylyltransferase family protein [Candidatus Xenobia bacterium]|nr:phosphocholine cytidylyltransferase family protein [Candidatus Xenobia bacterium]